MKMGVTLMLAAAASAILIGGGIFAYTILKDKTTAESLPNTAQAAEYHKITPEEVKSIMDSGTPYILLDVRTESEYNEAHINGAMLIPNTEITSRAEKELPDKNALLLVYCRSGARSSAASNELVNMGYTNVYDLGGIINWPFGTVTE